MNVSLLSFTPEPLRIIFTAARSCYSPSAPSEIWEKASDEDKMLALIKRTVDSGHHSVLEHVSFTFGVRGISRACSHQLVRHRLASYSQQSQRYVRKTDASAVVPGSISDVKKFREKFDAMLRQIGTFYNELVEAGIPAEDARYILPNAVTTNIVITMNMRELIHASSVRLCLRAQWEIRRLFLEMRKALEHNRETAPLSGFVLMKCEIIGFCDEADCCGIRPPKDEVLGLQKLTKGKVRAR
ncbi:MAG: FAD-dependent thymidylate synthase [Candidatus Eisenbacteria bacterium]|nr:FAD-dependent thymidylate synthase [Candidatus Eisenbacteria bacterium]